MFQLRMTEAEAWQLPPTEASWRGEARTVTTAAQGSSQGLRKGRRVCGGREGRCGGLAGIPQTEQKAGVSGRPKAGGLQGCLPEGVLLHN